MKRIAVALCALLVFARIPVAAQQCALPTDRWEVVPPDDVGLDSRILQNGDSAVEDDLPYLRSIVVIRHNCLAYERYFGGMGEDVRAMGFSITKSVTGTLIGIALENGDIASADDSIADYLPLPATDPRRDITVSHLLHMLSGLGWNEAAAEHIGGMLQLQRDEVTFILSLPLYTTPGTFWSYSTADSHLLSAILASATGETTLDYAREHLFSPLGIDDIEWTADANGNQLGGTHLAWRPRDMAKFGLLALHDGRWGDVQLVPAEWMSFMTTPQLPESFFELSYAAHWWHVNLASQAPMFTALGYGGQYILISPELDMVVVVTANSFAFPNVYVSGDHARLQEDAILDYIERYVLAAAGE